MLKVPGLGRYLVTGGRAQTQKCLYTREGLKVRGLAAQEFLVKWALQEELRVLAASGTQQVLVRKAAQTLLDAFRVNTVF